MNEISRITSNSIESETEISASHKFASEIYDQSNPKAPQVQSNISNPHDAKNSEHAPAQLAQIKAKQSDEVQPEIYYRLGHTEDESFRHIAQTWRHVLNGNATKLELLEFGIEAGAAIALLRFGVKKFWPMNTLPKSSAALATDDTILFQKLTGAQAKTHPVMNVHIRTWEAPTYTPR